MLKNFGKIIVGLIIVKNLFCVVGLKVEGGKWHVGTGSSGTWVSPSTFTVKNIGDEPIKVEIKATNSQNRTLGTSPGLDTFSIQYGDGITWTPITVDFTTLVSKLNPNEIFSFFLRYQSPTEISNPYLTTTQFSTITFLAESITMIAIFYILTDEWGGYGTEDSQFVFPFGITVDSLHNVVYVVDRGNNRVQKFDTDGNFITKWGKYGAGDGEFTELTSITIDPNQNSVYVTEQGHPETGNHRVQKFDYSGNFITKWGRLGWEDGKFSFPWGIAVDNNGNVYVADRGHDRIQKFNPFGDFISSFKISNNTYGICIDPLGYIYIAVPLDYMIQKFTSSGLLVCEIKTDYKPCDIDVDSRGRLYVTDLTNHRILVYTPQY